MHTELDAYEAWVDWKNNRCLYVLTDEGNYVEIENEDELRTYLDEGATVVGL